jgi:hypothetical protein
VHPAIRLATGFHIHPRGAKKPYWQGNEIGGDKCELQWLRVTPARALQSATLQARLAARVVKSSDAIAVMLEAQRLTP